MNEAEQADLLQRLESLKGELRNLHRIISLQQEYANDALREANRWALKAEEAQDAADKIFWSARGIYRRLNPDGALPTWLS